MKRMLIGLLALVGAASSGCIIEEEGRPHHVHCVGCGHVYVHGYWR